MAVLQEISCLVPISSLSATNNETGSCVCARGTVGLSQIVAGLNLKLFECQEFLNKDSLFALVLTCPTHLCWLQEPMCHACLVVTKKEYLPLPEKGKLGLLVRHRAQHAMK